MRNRTFLVQNFLETLIDRKASTASSSSSTISSTSDIHSERVAHEQPISKRVVLAAVKPPPPRQQRQELPVAPATKQDKGKQRVREEEEEEEDRATAVNLDKMTEDEMLAHALALSEAAAAKTSTPLPVLDDSDMQEVMRQSLLAFEGQVQRQSTNKSGEPSKIANGAPVGDLPYYQPRDPPLSVMDISPSSSQTFAQLHQQQQLAQRDSTSMTSEMVNDIKVRRASL